MPVLRWQAGHEASISALGLFSEIYTHTYIYLYIHTHICIYIYTYVGAIIAANRRDHRKYSCKGLRINIVDVLDPKVCIFSILGHCWHIQKPTATRLFIAVLAGMGQSAQAQPKLHKLDSKTPQLEVLCNRACSVECLWWVWGFEGWGLYYPSPEFRLRSKVAQVLTEIQKHVVAGTCREITN